MNIAVDIDGTIDAAPQFFAQLMRGLRAGGNYVAVVTGWDDDAVTPDDVQEKVDYLDELGCGDCYDQLVVVPHPHPENKAKWLEENDSQVLIDNNMRNIKAAPDGVFLLVPWDTRIKKNGKPTPAAQDLIDAQGDRFQ